MKKEAIQDNYCAASPSPSPSPQKDIYFAEERSGYEYRDAPTEEIPIHPMNFNQIEPFHIEEVQIAPKMEISNEGLETKKILIN